MNGPLGWLWADAAPQLAETTWRFARLREYGDERWFLPSLVAGSLLIVLWVGWLYRRDSVELRPGVGLLLLLMRLGALAAALFFYLDLEQRTQRELVHNSRVLIAVDTSQSMGLADSDASGVPAGPGRIDQVVEEFSRGELIDSLRKVHDVAIARFDKDVARIVTLPRQDLAAVAMPDAAPAADPPPFDWKTALLPQGAESQLGTALKRLIDEERAAPLSGILVLTDGANNAGLDPRAAIEAAREAQLPIYPIGLGSERVPKSARIADLVAPSRAFPEDSFTITGYVQGQGLAGRSVRVELFSWDAVAGEAGRILEHSATVTLGLDGELVPVRFELSSDEAQRRTFRLQVEDLPDDLKRSDNQQEVDVEIIERETRVLLIAGAASREYQFLRNELRRDKSFVVDVWLQASPVGISQDAHEILVEFPAAKEELMEYDAIVAFDADWTLLDAAQVDLLEAWVAEQAGGLVAIAGPVHTDGWTREERMSKLRDLYPVEFHRRLALLSDAEYGSAQAWPLAFEPAGISAPFLWIEDSAAESEAAWQKFPGVFGFYAVKGAKPGATVYARFSDPEAGISDEQPVYLASQFYGSGRVFYLGSGEMWRLRGQDEAHFEKLYTKLIRYVSEGRLLRGSSRGSLLVERDRYSLGDTVVVRAQLTDAQHEPLALEMVELMVTQPDSTTLPLTLKIDPSRKGMYVGQFTVLQEGPFRIDLAVPHSAGEQLTRRLQVRVPDREGESPQRNDALLGELAERTGGTYYLGLASIQGSGDLPSLVGQLKNRQETTILTGAPDADFERAQMSWILGMISGLLCLEWLIRRLCRLA